MSGQRAPGTGRVAIVGGGPRTLWALERLATLAGEPGARLPDGVDVFARDEVLGAGTTYEPLQPPWLLVNVTSRVVDCWLDPDRGPSLDAWREQREPGSSADEYPPRSTVGAYLHEQGRVMIERLETQTQVRVARREVTQVHRSASGWTIDAQPGTTYDQVLLCTGHGDDWSGALRHTWPLEHPTPLHDRVFPVGALLARPELGGEQPNVVVRGAALTGIDAALTLAHHAGDVRICLVSRTGRPMHPKSLPEVVATWVDSALGRRAVAWAKDRVARGEEVPGILVELAVALLDRADADDVVAAATQRIARAAPDLNPVAELRDAAAVARGDRPPGGEWGLAQAWRALYPTLVRRQAGADHHGPLLGWPDAGAWARELERWAFGPPLINADRLLSLVAGGRVELRSGSVAEVAQEAGADLVVDAVLAPPGVRDVARDSVLARLVADGIVHPAPQGRGALVGADGSVPGAPGLAVIGRATEDVVLGNDTLVRSLHPAPDLWARRVLGLPAPADGLPKA